MHVTFTKIIIKYKILKMLIITYSYTYLFIYSYTHINRALLKQLQILWRFIDL